MFNLIGKELYQWDVGRKVEVKSSEITEVHFSNTEINGALVVKPYQDGGIIACEIPNILLQSSREITVYAVVSSKNDQKTLGHKKFFPIPKPKPDDYVYTETEALNYAELEKRISVLEENPISDEKIAEAIDEYLEKNPIAPSDDFIVAESDPTVPDWAKQSTKPTYTAEEVGGIPIPITAKVGQTITASEVDENGKPTKWSPADLPRMKTNAWRKIIDMTISENCTSIKFDVDDDGNPIKAVKYFILLESTIPTDESWTTVRPIAVAPWKTKMAWNDGLTKMNSGISYKSTSKTSSALYIEILDGMAHAIMWRPYNDGSVPNALIHTSDITYHWNPKRAKERLTKPYSEAIEFDGTQTCFSAGSTLTIWAIDYVCEKQ